MNLSTPALLVTRPHALLLALCSAGLGASAAHAQLSPSVIPFTNRTLFQTAAPNATNTINFQEFNLGDAQTSGFLPAFTELGFVTFKTNSNYVQEIIDGFNVGQGNNDVYTTLASNKNSTIADVAFGAGVFSLGFDFKNTANGAFSAGLIAQPFTFQLFSGSTSLGSFIETVVPNGSTFAFAGFVSTLPITELIITSVSASPNLDVVLDNFALPNQVPEPSTWALMAGGLLALVGWQRDARRKQPALG